MINNIKSYFKNLPCYWSANLFAMVGFLALLMVMVYIISYISILSNIGMYNLFAALLTIIFYVPYVCAQILIIYTIFPLSIPLYYLLNGKNKILRKVCIIIFLWLIIILPFIIKCFFYEVLEPEPSIDIILYFLGALALNNTLKFILMLLFSLIVFCKFVIKDIVNPKLLQNTELINNKYYRRFFYTCFIFFMVAVFIPTVFYLTLMVIMLIL